MEERGGGIIRLLSSPPIVLDERETVAPLPPPLPPPPAEGKGRNRNKSRGKSGNLG